MTQEPIDRYFGIPMSEWIARVPNELEVDAVGLWQIIPVGIDSFGLSGSALDDFTRRCIIELLDRGAVPVEAAKTASGWVSIQQYHGSHRDIVDLIISDWKSGKITVDQDSVWFALPENFA